MKKLFMAVMAVAAIALVGCNNEELNPNKKEQQALNFVTPDATIQLIALDSAAVDKKFTDAGFVKVEAWVEPNLPKRARQPRKALNEDSGAQYLEYFYGLPANYFNLSDSASQAVFAEAIKKLVIDAVVQLVDGKVYSVEAYPYISEDSKTPYITVFDKAYKLIPAGSINSETVPMTEWYGAFSDSLENEPAAVKNHEELITLIKNADEVSAIEYAQVIKTLTEDGKYTGFFYQVYTVIPGKERAAEMVKEEGFSYGYMMSYVCDNSGEVK